MTLLDLQITRKRVVAQGIVTLELRDPQQRPLPAFTAGAHIDVYIGPQLTRQYSLCNAPDETDRYVLGVLLEPNSRGGSAAMHGRFAEGDTITVSAPRNNFPLASARRTLLFGGGIGITPLLSMAEALWRTQDDFEFTYCARSASHAAFLDRLAAAPYAARTRVHLDDGPLEQRLQLDARLAQEDPSLTHLYVCGPKGFIDHVCRTADERGWPQAHIHVEHFSLAQPVAGEALTVQIASTGQRIEIPPDESITTALERHGVSIPVSCEQGICGTCLTRVVSGEIEHRDGFLTAGERAQGDQMTPCCSRGRGTLVLDL
ncbi:MAG: oxidoreductase [Rubrivivax sp.]|nr:MAG: oxidoreductase [Rubrivivax sp.]